MNQLNHSLTQDQYQRIFYKIAWDPRLDTDVDSLYHYYPSETLKLVLKKENIIFRLASASTFKDKLEGKAVESYYKTAIQELLSEKKISKKDYNLLITISIPERISIVYLPINGYGIISNECYEEYIICFSKKKNDERMYKEYGDHCLEFFTLDLRELTLLGARNHSEVKLLSVKYGREAIDYIKTNVELVINDRIRGQDIEYYISNLLHIVQYSSKSMDFSHEEEVRLIAFLPKNCEEKLPNIRIPTDRNHKEYIYLSVPKNILFGLYSSKNINIEESTNIKNYLSQNGYSIPYNE